MANGLACWLRVQKIEIAQLGTRRSGTEAWVFIQKLLAWWSILWKAHFGYYLLWGYVHHLQNGSIFQVSRIHGPENKEKQKWAHSPSFLGKFVLPNPSNFRFWRPGVLGLRLEILLQENTVKVPLSYTCPLLDKQVQKRINCLIDRGNGPWLSWINKTAFI